LKTLPFIAPGAPSFSKYLDECRGSHLEGFVMGLSQNEFLRIDSGVNFLEVQDHISGLVVLQARLNRVSTGDAGSIMNGMGLRVIVPVVRKY
jgi:hypothetical protein